MDSDALISSLDRFGRILPTLLRDVSDSDARWKPDDGAWSILEIVTHLADEEVEDFRRRLGLTLTDPDADWPPIDPVGWAVERRYNEGGLAKTVGLFVSRRQESVVWLRGLDSPDWSITKVHPKFGPLLAGDLLTAWAAHDMLHLRQISKRMYEVNCVAGDKYSSRYAGEW